MEQNLLIVTNISNSMKFAAAHHAQSEIEGELIM